MSALPEDEGPICSICQYEYTPETSKFTKCIHGFHKLCIDKWMNEKKYESCIPCPVCNYNIDETFETTEEKLFKKLAQDNTEGVGAIKQVRSIARRPISHDNLFNLTPRNISIGTIINGVYVPQHLSSNLDNTFDEIITLIEANRGQALLALESEDDVVPL
jgi:hypothetical protein